MDTTLEFTSELARQAGEMLMSRFKLSGMAATYKADRSVVTESDVAADQLITQSIQAEYPADRILSEELKPDYSSTTDAAWVIDPLDGTTNYSLGLQYWGISIARLVGGWPATAVLYFPMLDEFYTARRGLGASLNGGPLQVKELYTARPATFFACCSRTFRRYQIGIPYKPRILGSAAYNFCCVARGAAIIAFEARAKIWDIAGAWLVVKEAGAIIEPYNLPSPFPLLGGDYTNINFPTLAAWNLDILSGARSQIQPLQKIMPPKSQ